MQLIKMFFRLQKWCQARQLNMAASLVLANKEKMRELANEINNLENENIELRDTYLS